MRENTLIFDMTGVEKNRIKVLGYHGNDGYGSAMWDCLCNCGNTFVARGKSIRNGDTKSCGCLKTETGRNQLQTHGLSSTRLYKLWTAILTRCYNQNFTKYHLYGGRGITVCDEWRDDFMAFRAWSLSNGYSENIADSGRNKITLDREDTDGNYEPSNCRWTSQTIQCRNQNLRKDNISGQKGVTFDNNAKKWRAGIGKDGKYYHIGLYDTVEQAISARLQAEPKYWGVG